MPPISSIPRPKAIVNSTLANRAMGKLLLRERDLQNSEKVSRFMQEEGFFAAEKNRAVGLEIFPKKTLSKNKLILYRLVFSRGAEKFKKKNWGKTRNPKKT